MRNYLIIISLVLAQSVCSQTKILTNPIEQPTISNTDNQSCASAIRVCESITQNFHFENSETAPCGSHTLYYFFNFEGASNGQIQASITGGSGTWEWFGILSDFSLDVCDQINSYTASSINGNFGSGPITLNSADEGYYVLKITTTSCTGTINLSTGFGDPILNCSDNILCTECVTSFSPTPGKYIVSAWVKEENASNSTTTYTNSSVEISFQNSTFVIPPLLPTGAIIDGWQRIEAEIEVPNDATGINIELIADGADVYFDDIRFFPIDGSMMSYVYDPISLRLMAELDERNYATLYEYDEEGKLIRVKKETEKGIMTIQENRDNIKKN
jgi:hypothetical protein